MYAYTKDIPYIILSSVQSYTCMFYYALYIQFEDFHLITA